MTVKNVITNTEYRDCLELLIGAMLEAEDRNERENAFGLISAIFWPDGGKVSFRQIAEMPDAMRRAFQTVLSKHAQYGWPKSTTYSQESVMAFLAFKAKTANHYASDLFLAEAGRTEDDDIFGDLLPDDAKAEGRGAKEKT